MKNIFDTVERKNAKYRVKYHNEDSLVCVKFLVFFLGKLLKNIFKVNFKYKQKSNNIRLGFYLWGGIGDALINLNYICHFVRYIGSEKIQLDLYFEKPSFLNFVSELNFINKCYVGDDFNLNDYDIFISLLCFPRILKYDKNLVELKSEKLYDLMNIYEKFNNDNFKIISAEPHSIPMEEKLASIQGKMRINQADIGQVLGISEDFILPLTLKNIDETLAKFGLSGNNFITLNRSAGSVSKNNTKLWPIENYNQLIKLLKEKYPDVKFVQIGDNNQTAYLMDDIDVNLVGKTDLEELKIILSRAKLHIDSEGGLVHIRKALNGGPSVVLFGPTSKDFFGYSANINIKSENVCYNDCQWISDNWDSMCVKTGTNDNPCMTSINPEMVFNIIKDKEK